MGETKTRILIVDDDENLRKTLGDILKIKGYLPVYAENAQQAFDQLEKREPAIALIDLRLEGMPGMEILRDFKARSSLIECILLTGHVSQESAIQGIQLGAFSYLQKPLNMEQLMLTIQRAVEKRAAEIEIREEKKRYQTLAETSPVGIFQSDARGATTYVNPRWCEITGLPAEQALGDGWLRAVHPEDRKKVAAGWKKALKERRISKYNLRFMRPDGTTIWVLGQATPETNLSGKVTGYIGTITDISEQKQAEDILRHSEDRYRDLVEHSHDLICTHDLEGRLLSINPAAVQISGYSEKELLQMSLRDLLTPVTRDRFDAYLAEIKTKSLASGLMITQAKNGEERILEYHNTLRTQGLETPVIRGTARDITERVRAENALRQNERQVQRLLEQQIAINQLALALGESLDIKEIYATVCKHLRSLVDVWCFIISSYDEQTKMIRAEYAEADQVYDVSAFPPIQLGKPGQGTQSRVIHSGQPYYTPDHQRAVRTSKARYTVEEDGSVHEELPSEKETEKTTRSAVYLPMKVKGKPVGVMQVQSTRLDAYSQEDIQLLAALANVAAVAIQDASLRQAVQQELEERQRVEHSLRKSEERYRTLFERMMDGMYRSTHEGRFLEVNPAMARMFGYASKEEILAVDIQKELYFSPEERGSHLLDTGQEEIDVYRMRRKDGSEIWVEDRGLYIHDEQGNVIYHEGMLRDVTERKQAEQELRASEERYRLLLEAIQDSVYILDREWRHTLVNQAAEPFTGLPRDRLLGAKLTDLFPGVERTPFFATFQRVMQTGVSEVVSDKFSFVDGREGWYEVLVSPVAEGILCISRDITERKRAEQVLYESEQRHRILFEESPVSLWEEDFSKVKQRIEKLRKRGVKDFRAYFRKHPQVVTECATLVEVINVNRATLGLFRARDKEELLRDLTFFFCDESYDNFRDELIQIAEGRTSFSWEGINQTLDGRRLHVNMRWSVAPGHEDDFSKVLVSILDITERVRGEEALSESEKRYRLLVEQLPAVIYRDALDEDTTTLFISPQIEELTGYTAEEWIAEPGLWRKSLHPEDRERALAENRRHYQNNETFLSEYRLLARDGRAVWVRDEAQVVFDDAGRPLYAQGVLSDITARKQAEETLRLQSAALEASANAILITDREGLIEWINPAFTGLTGYSRMEVIGKNPRELVRSNLQGKDFYKNLWDTILRGETWRGELTNRRKDGSLYIEEATITPLLDPQGSITHFIGVKQDISLRKQAEATLRKRADELAALYETLRELAEQRDLLPLLHTIVERARGLLNAPSGGVYLYDPARDDLELIVTINPMVSSGMRMKMGEGLAGRVAQNRQPLMVEDYSAWEGRSSQYKHIPFRATLQAPMLYDNELIGVLSVDEIGESRRKFTPEELNLLTHFAHQAAVAVGKARLYEEARQRVTELEVLFESSLVLASLLDPPAIGKKIVEILAERLDWHHAVVRVRQPESDALEVIGYGAPSLRAEDQPAEIARMNKLIARVGQGMTGWVIQHGQPVRCDDLPADSRYIETYPGIRSGLYAPMKTGEQVLGALGVESEIESAFDADDERLLTTLAAQAAAALQTAHLFEKTRRRVLELETLNRISLALRAVSRHDEMLAVVLEETLNALGSLHGSINLWHEATQDIRTIVARGWVTKITETPIKSGEGIFGSVFASGRTHVSKEFASDALTRDSTRGKIQAGWGGICAPIISSEQTLGVLLVSIPSEREPSRDQVRLVNTIAEMTGAALHRLSLYEQTSNHLDTLQSLRIVDQAISASFDLRPVLEIVLNQTVTRLGMDAANILLLNPLSNSLEYSAGRGFHYSGIERPPVRLGQGPAGRAALERRLLRDPNLIGMAEANLTSWMPGSEAFKEYYAAPLIAKGEVKGVLEVLHHAPLSLTSEQLQFLETLAGQTAIAIDNNQLFDNLQRANLELAVAYDATIEGWSRALDLRDQDTEGHSERVMAITLQLAKAFELSGLELNHIRRGALLHDIGKMGVPDSILHKPGTLTEKEWEIMRRHPQLAYEMLAPIAYLRQALDIPWCHHEKWDGSGYPRGLKGEQIPLAARIFAVADVYDALINDRPYRKAWAQADALKYIVEQRGKHFDPEVVDKFLQIISEE